MTYTQYFRGNLFLFTTEIINGKEVYTMSLVKKTDYETGYIIFRGNKIKVK